MVYSETYTKTELQEKIKRFNYVYFIVFIITIMLAIGANTFAKDNLAGAILFSFGSLAIWVYGHLIGAKPSQQENEIKVKLIAWLFVSLVACTVILKYILNTTSLDSTLSIISFGISYFSMFGIFRLLIQGFSDRGKVGFVLLILPISALLLLVYPQIAIF